MVKLISPFLTPLPRDDKPRLSSPPSSSSVPSRTPTATVFAPSSSPSWSSNHMVLSIAAALLLPPICSTKLVPRIAAALLLPPICSDKLVPRIAAVLLQRSDMMHKNPVQYGSPDGTGIDVDADYGDWTAGKRRKHLAPSLHSEVRTCSSDSPPAQGDQGDPLFTEDVTISLDEVKFITTFMKDKPFIFVDFGSILNDKYQRRVYQRLLLYRLRAHKLSNGESGDKLDDETLKKELPDFLIKEQYIPQLHFDVHNYFKHLEKEEPVFVDWYFDPEFSKLKDLANYQRLVLKNHDDAEYLNWEGYRSTFTTYKMDENYVKFFAEMSRKLQWLKKLIGTKGSEEWVMKTEVRGAHQALKIAKEFPDVTVDLAYIAYGEHIWSLQYDHLYCEGWDTTFLEIWKLVTRDKMEFTHALMKVKDRHLFPQHDADMLRFLKNRRLLDLESKFDKCVECMPPGAGDEVAEEVIKKAVWELTKKKMLHQYMERKMSIAKEIGLDEDEPRTELWDGPKISHSMRMM